MVTLTRILLAFLLLAFPGALVLLLISALILLVCAGVKNKRAPGRVPAERITVYKVLIAASGAMAGFLILDTAAMDFADRLRIAGYDPPGAIMPALLLLLLFVPIAFAVACAFLCVFAERKEQSTPGSVSAKGLLIHRTLAIVSGVMAALISLIVIALFAMIPLIVYYITG